MTISLGILAFVAERLFEKLWLEPIREQWNARGEVACALIYHASVFSNPGVGPAETRMASSKALRELASRLRATAEAIPWYGALVTVRLLLPWANISSATSNLIGLSNSVDVGDSRANAEREAKVRESLRLRE